MKNTLFAELIRMTALSVLIFAVMFAVLYVIEWLCPGMKGVLLQWHDTAFCVGLPASIAGVAYVLTIRNPRNYMGFYLGIVMAVLLAVQFYYQANYDLMVLYIVFFVPFLTISLIKWRKATLHPETVSAADDEIAFIGVRPFWWTTIIFVLIMVVDYVLATLVMRHDGWGDAVAVKLLSGAMIATSVMANYWLIYKKNDAWLHWVLFSVVGIALYLLINNAFSLILYVVFLLVNGQAQIVWLRNTKPANMGWVSRFIHN